MNQQGVVWQELFLERRYANAAPPRSLLNQRKELWQGLRLTSSTSARKHGFEACWKVATFKGGRRFCARTLIVPRDRDCRPEGRYRLRLRCARTRSAEETEAGRKAIDVGIGIGIVVPIEDIADLIP
jgi:hypothetical protein